MNHRPVTILALLAMLALAGCLGAPATTTSSSQVPTEVPATPGATSTAAATSAPTAEPVPSDELGEFSCELPIVETATLPVTSNYNDVRIGAHDGYDRVVFEFIEGTPELTLDRDEPPFHQDGSGFEIAVDGSSFLRLTMRGATKLQADGTNSYEGPTNFQPGLSQLVHLIEGGDFEAQSTWYFGLNAEACVRLMLLEGPDRIVIDIQH
jgi:hypothetical protein